MLVFKLKEINFFSKKSKKMYLSEDVQNILYKILGAYALLLCILGTIFNILVCFICTRRRLRVTNTFKFIAILSLSDTIALYEWNLKHFITPYFKIDFNFTSLVWCRLGIFLQYAFLQYSAWILVYFKIAIK